jgi:tRNA(Ile2) C34 agmatinyltransferase TiaS
MERYLVGECPRCHALLIADGRYKSKTCPKCNARIPLADLKTLHAARDSRDARAFLSKEKAVRGGLDQT